MGKGKLEGGRSAGWAFMDRFDAPDYDDPAKTYLTRWRILSTPWFGIYLHRITGPDPRPTLHDHPWPFVSLILRGGYQETVRRGLRGGVSTEHALLVGHGNAVDESYQPARIRRVRWFNVKRAEDAHTITRLHRSPTWTLLFSGRRRRVWGYLDDDGTWTRFDKHPHSDEFQTAMAARKAMTEETGDAS